MNVLQLSPPLPLLMPPLPIAFTADVCFVGFSPHAPPPRPQVFQLETAMGAAIECFKGAGAVAVPRYRFAPVKKCNDLLLLRSDAYVVNEHYNIVLAPER